MSQMCPVCSQDNPDDAQICTQCSSPLRGLLGDKTMLGERYQVVSVLGCGAMGAVYLADDQRLAGRRTAIKENRLDPSASSELQAQAREQFLAEASVMARLDHPGLPKVSDYFIENGREYLVMDYVEGEDLESRIQRAKEPLDELLVLSWADQVLDALNYLHNQSPQPIIHRDIKPANLRLNIQNRIKLVDFGLVKLLDVNNPETKVELRGLGTPAYAPLEQFAGSDSHTDARSDVYALGATIYHLVTHLYPPDVHERLLNPEILVPPRELNSKLSEKTEAVILKAMGIHPDERFQSAEEMRMALADAADEVSAAVVVPPVEANAEKRSTSTWVFGLLALVFVFIILGSIIFIFFGEQTALTSEPVQTSAGLVGEQPEPTATEVLKGFVDAPTDTPTPVVEDTPSPTDTPTPVVEDTPTPTATPIIEETATPDEGTPTAQAPLRGIPASSLVGTIAYPVFNGKDYDLYFGQADGSGTELFRNSASQPAFSPDGTRIAFHSWSLDAWGLINMDVSGDDPLLVATFVEDQLPTWSTDGQEIVFLSRREGDRKSRLLKVGSQQLRSDGAVMGEGEYPSIGPSGQLVFKGWGATGSGIKISSTSLTNIRQITDRDEDTAPALSRDGQQVVFMSRRAGNWEIYIANTDGSGIRRLTENPAEDGLPIWSPDGNVIAFVSNRGGQWAVWAMLPDGSDQQKLFDMEGSPDGFIGANRSASRGWAEERISWTE